MKANFYRQQLQELMAMVEQKQGHQTEQIQTLPLSDYTNEEKWAAEKAMFKQLPLLVGHRSQLKSPGDFFVHEDLGPSLLIVRTQNNEVKAYYNYCQHRGSKLVHDSEGAGKKRFNCPYHAWSYDLEGKLAGVPREDLFPCLKREEKGLKEVYIEEKFGFLWVIQDPALGLTVADYFQGLEDDLAFLGAENNAVYFNKTRSLKANWKLPLDAFLESYHIGVLHKDSVGEFFIKHVSYSEFIGPHIRSIVPRENFGDLADQDWETANCRDYVSPTFILFPHTCFVLHPTSLSILTLYPGDHPGESYWNHLLLVPEEPKTERQIKHYEKTIKVLDGMTYEGEDFWISEQIQQGLDHQGLTEITLGLTEGVIGHFHRLVDEYAQSKS